MEHERDEDRHEEARQDDESREGRERLYRVTSVVDRKVINRDGEELGEIEDLVMDPDDGTVIYAALSYGSGFLNMSEKYFAIPWQAIQMDEAHGDVIIDVDKEKLEDAPGFDKDSWPDRADDRFARDVHEYYGYEYPDRSGHAA
jgi:sporulation protein YlmC with PRC-barrel domain